MARTASMQRGPCCSVPRSGVCARGSSQRLRGMHTLDACMAAAFRKEDASHPTGARTPDAPSRRALSFPPLEQALWSARCSTFRLHAGDASGSARDNHSASRRAERPWRRGVSRRHCAPLDTGLRQSEGGSGRFLEFVCTGPRQANLVMTKRFPRGSYPPRGPPVASRRLVRGQKRSRRRGPPRNVNPASPARIGVDQIVRQLDEMRSHVQGVQRNFCARASHCLYALPCVPLWLPAPCLYARRICERHTFASSQRTKRRARNVVRESSRINIIPSVLAERKQPLFEHGESPEHDRDPMLDWEPSA